MKQSPCTVILDEDPKIAQLVAESTQLPTRHYVEPEVLLSHLASGLRPVSCLVSLDVVESRALRSSLTVGDVVAQIRGLSPLTPVIVLASNFSCEGLGRAMAEGAHDYVVKPIVIDDLLLRMRVRVHELLARSASDTLEVGVGRLNVHKRVLEGPGGTVFLSPLQAELLRVLAEARGAVVEKPVLKKAIWGRVAVTDNALDRRISDLRRILADSGAGVLLVAEYGKGVCLQSLTPPRNHAVLRSA